MLSGIALAFSVGCSKGPPRDFPPSSADSAPLVASKQRATTQSALSEAPALAEAGVLEGAVRATAPTLVATPRTTAPPLASTPNEPRVRQPRVERDAFVEFGADTTVAEVATDPTGAEAMYVVEADGTLRVLDTSAQRPQLVRAFRLFPRELGPAQGFGRLELVDPHTALLPTQGPGFVGLALFDPVDARSSRDVTWFDLSELRVTWPEGTRNSQGIQVGGRPLPLTNVTGATLVGETVFLCAANTDAEGDHRPGVVAALHLDLAERRLEARALIRTSAFNPTGVRRLGAVLLVTNSGSFGQSGASVDVIDVESATRRATISVPQQLADGRVADPFGPVVISADGRRGYLGSLHQARVYALDLETLTYAEDMPLPSDSLRNSTRHLALSSDGSTLYASNKDDSSLNVVDLRAKEVTRVSGFARSGDSDAREGLVDNFVVQRSSSRREGESLLAVTTDLATADRAQPDVSVSLDRVSLQ